MNTDTLPPPDTHCWDEDTSKDVWSYSADQMRAYAEQAVAAAQMHEPGVEYKRGYEEALNDCLRNGLTWARSLFANGAEHIKPAEPVHTTITWDAQGRRLVNGALAPEHRADSIQEPIFWYRDFGAGPMICAKDHPDARPLCAAPQQRNLLGPPDSTKAVAESEAAPQQRKPLSQDDVRTFAESAGLDWQRGYVVDDIQNRYEDFARAIEEAIWKNV